MTETTREQLQRIRNTAQGQRVGNYSSGSDAMQALDLIEQLATVLLSESSAVPAPTDDAPVAPAEPRAAELPEGYTVPEGWEWTGEVRPPLKGEWHIAYSVNFAGCAEYDFESNRPRPILRRVAPPQAPAAKGEPAPCGEVGCEDFNPLTLMCRYGGGTCRANAEMPSDAPAPQRAGETTAGDYETLASRISFSVFTSVSRVLHQESYTLHGDVKAAILSGVSAYKEDFDRVAAEARAEGERKGMERAAKMLDNASLYAYALHRQDAFREAAQIIRADLSADCPSTHCNRRAECSSPNDCIRTEKARHEATKDEVPNG